MKTYYLKSHYKKIIADTVTPVSIYLKLRDRFPNSILLESSDYHGNENSFSYVCFNPIASVQLQNEQLTTHYPDGTKSVKQVDSTTDIPGAIDAFARRFKTDKTPFKFIHNGLFGYIAYDAVRYFEDVQIKKRENTPDIPDIHYSVFQNIIAIDHFKNQAYIFSHSAKGDNNIEKVMQLLKTKNFASYNFTPSGDERSDHSDEDYVKKLAMVKKHCYRGDVFQIVLSRRFSQGFKGDEFNVYRALRSVNPSPYLFYFDYGTFKIFGSSPEAQLIVKDGKAEIHPIAGTVKRSGQDEKDAQMAKKLTEDPKENAEHVMLVDLARNDLSRNGSQVVVAIYKEIQHYSHVIHLVSKVTGSKHPGTPTMRVVADTFPAGTLSGAPKHKAMQLIERYETVNRGCYGGAIGFMDFKGNFNHAIIIRSFLSKDHRLYYQAGGGIVSESKPENELQEVYNKLGALKKAMELAKTIEN